MKACFMGLGYIGLPTAIIAAKHGAYGGGYLALVVKDAKEFIKQHSEAFELKIRRE